jgi:hypothetical protein
MPNTIRIKRRASANGAGAPSSLANAELAFNENSNILYYGTGTGGAGGSATSVIAIGGSGAFVSITEVRTANTVLAGPTSGAAAAPTFRALVAGDIPSLSGVYIPMSGTATPTGTYTFSGTVNVTGTFQLGSTTVTSSAAELNLIDGSIANTVVNSKAVIYGSAGQIAATTIATSGNATVGGDLTVTGNLTVNGTVTTVNSTTVTVDDKNLELGSVYNPTDTTADGGGITLKGTTDKTILWTNSTDSWTYNQNIELAATYAYRIDGASVLNKTTLGSTVVSSSLTSVGTIATGVWNGTAIGVAYGGTGLTSAPQGSVLVANLANTYTALDGGGSSDGLLAYTASSDTIAWATSIDGGTF